MPFFWIVSLALADRLRGSGWMRVSHTLGMAYMGAITAVLLDTHGLMFLYVMAAVMLGAASGWGNPLGAVFDQHPMDPNTYEWWQVGILRREAFLALIARGLMWGALLAPVSLWGTLAYTVAFTLSPYIVRPFRLQFTVDMWGVMEATRGAMIAVIILLTTP